MAKDPMEEVADKIAERLANLDDCLDDTDLSISVRQIIKQEITAHITELTKQRLDALLPER